MSSLANSRALWNRSHLDLHSDETLAKILDRGSLEDWRELWRLLCDDPQLRSRVRAIVAKVPLPLPRLWLAALANLGEPVDLGILLPEYRLDV